MKKVILSILFLVAIATVTSIATKTYRMENMLRMNVDFLKHTSSEPDCEQPEYGHAPQVFYPHENYCDLYYMCVDGYPILLPCRDGLVWNQQTLRFAFPSEHSEVHPGQACSFAPEDVKAALGRE